MPVSDVAEDDAHLFLWTTSHHMRDAFTVVDAWGFRFRQMLVWAKVNPMPMSMPFAPPRLRVRARLHAREAASGARLPAEVVGRLHIKEVAPLREA